MLTRDHLWNDGYVEVVNTSCLRADGLLLHFRFRFDPRQGNLRVPLRACRGSLIYQFSPTTTQTAAPA
jgi:hypothetical protein